MGRLGGVGVDALALATVVVGRAVWVRVVVGTIPFVYVSSDDGLSAVVVNSCRYHSLVGVMV